MRTTLIALVGAMSLAGISPVAVADIIIQSAGGTVVNEDFPTPFGASMGYMYSRTESPLSAANFAATATQITCNFGTSGFAGNLHYTGQTISFSAIFDVTEPAAASLSGLIQSFGPGALTRVTLLGPGVNYDNTLAGNPSSQDPLSLETPLAIGRYTFSAYGSSQAIEQTHVDATLILTPAPGAAIVMAAATITGTCRRRREVANKKRKRLGAPRAC